MSVGDEGLKYFCFLNLRNNSSETGKLYGGVDSLTIHRDNQTELFSVTDGLLKTEKLYNMEGSSTLECIEITSMPAGKLATIPPSRTEMLYLITKYKKIDNPLIRQLHAGNILLHSNETSFHGVIEQADEGANLLQTRISEKGNVPDESLISIKDNLNRTVSNEDFYTRNGINESKLKFNNQTVNDYVNLLISQIGSSATIIVDVSGGLSSNPRWFDTMKTIGSLKPNM